MPAKPIRVFWSPVGQCFYATSAYRDMGDGHFCVTGKKYDVTQDIASACVFHQIEFGAKRQRKGKRLGK